MLETLGILLSRSGVTTITQSEHILGPALAFEEMNRSGGVLGKPIVPVVYDPAGDNTAYRNLARKLLAQDEVNIIFGCSYPPAARLCSRSSSATTAYSSIPQCTTPSPNDFGDGTIRDISLELCDEICQMGE